MEADKAHAPSSTGCSGRSSKIRKSAMTWFACSELQVVTLVKSLMSPLQLLQLYRMGSMLRYATPG